MRACSGPLLTIAHNSGPILAVLRSEFRDVRKVLEIGSGSGQHAVTFATAMPHLTWQTSDRDENHAAIRQQLAASRIANALPPLSLDVQTARLSPATYDGVFSANTAHIMSEPAVAMMFAQVGRALRRGGIFCLYGPFRLGGEFNAPSNAAFHASLRARDAAMGIRHLEELDRLGTVNGLARRRLFAMPSNNFLVVWTSQGGNDHGNT